MKDVKDVLREARALVENGWCQGRFESFGFAVGTYYRRSANPVTVRHVAHGNERLRCYCVTGALSSVASSEDVLEEAVGALQRAGGECTWLPDWNDFPRRTHEEVLALFDAAMGDIS
jgi:hypothetical protein